MANRRALALHPNDSRVEYALATCLRMLTRAVYCGPAFRDAITPGGKMFEGTEFDGFLAGGKFDPYEAANELQKLGRNLA